VQAILGVLVYLFLNAYFRLPHTRAFRIAQDFGRSEDENELEKLKKDEITMEDTEVGRQAVKMAQSSIAGLSQTSNETLQKHIPTNQLKKLKSISI